MSLEPSTSDSPSSPRRETTEGRETGIVASVAVLALILGTLVQVVFPRHHEPSSFSVTLEQVPLKPMGTSHSMSTMTMFPVRSCLTPRGRAGSMNSPCKETRLTF